MESKSLYARAISPFKQAAAILVFFFLAILIIKGLGLVGVTDGDPIFIWEAAFTAIMIYVIFSAALCFSYPNKVQYFSYAIASFVIVVVITGVVAYYLGVMSVEDGRSDSFRWLYVVFTFSYLVLLSIVNAMHKILEVVKKQDARLRGEDS